MDVSRFILKPDWMGGLGKLASVENSSVSPFRMGKNTELTSADKNEMESLGILDSGGQITPAYQPCFDTMASTRSFARVRLTGGEGLFEYVTYSTDNGQEPFSLTTTRKGLEVSFPAPTAEIIEMLKQYIGDSLIRGTSFEAEVNNAEAVVLAALIDIQRRAVLTALGGGGTYLPEETSEQYLMECLDLQNKDAQWLLAVVGGLIESSPDTQAFQAAVETLRAAGHIIKTEAGVKLGHNLEILASRTPVIDKLLSLRAGLDLGNGQVVQVGFVCVQAGVNDMLMIESLGGRIHFEAISPALVLDYVRHFLNRPDVLGSVIVKIDAGRVSRDNRIADVVPPETNEKIKDMVKSDPAEVLCSACSAKIPPNGKFCIACGKPVETEAGLKPELCVSCGNPIKPKANFCNKCGVRVNVAG